MRNHEVATLILGIAITTGLVMAQDVPAVPELTSAEKTTIKLLQAELQNAQLTVQIHLTRAQIAQALIQTMQAEISLEVSRLRIFKEATVNDFNFDLATLTFSKRSVKKNE